MKEFKGDLWEYPADVRIITTNGDINRFGLAVMGRGVALQARSRYKNIDVLLGDILIQHGNHVFWLYNDLISFPVKHHWREKADIALIERSIKELMEIANKHEEWKVIAIPRPGCGNGNLKWSDVKLILERYLDDRFIVINNE